MKKLMLICLIGVFVMASTVASAQQKASLGAGNLAVKLDYIQFTEDEFEDADIDSGWYVGLENYYEVTPNLYLGMEVGYTSPDGSFDEEEDGEVYEVDVEMMYVPLELNLKYAVEVAPQLILDFGAGVSYNYADIEVKWGGDSDDEDEWLFGGQFFLDLNYTFDQFFLGVNGKYQITEEGDDLELSFDNWRIGGQIGFVF